MPALAQSSLHMNVLKQNRKHRHLIHCGTIDLMTASVKKEESAGILSSANFMPARHGAGANEQHWHLHDVTSGELSFHYLPAAQLQ